MNSVPSKSVLSTKDVPRNFRPTIINAAYLIRRTLLKAVARHAPALSGSMMDFGCGSKPYRSLFNVAEYVGVDFHGEGHSHENEQIDVFYDGHTLPFEDARFDAVFSSEVFEHVFNLEDMLKEINRVLKPGGKMLITCPFAICEHEAPNDFGRYTSYGLTDLLHRNGFEIETFEKAGSAVRTICQLFVSYFYTHVLRRVFGKIPGVRTGVKVVFVPLLNGLSILLDKTFPSGPDLYMNNVVLAVKRKIS